MSSACLVSTLKSTPNKFAENANQYEKSRIDSVKLIRNFQNHE